MLEKIYVITLLSNSMESYKERTGLHHPSALWEDTQSQFKEDGLERHLHILSVLRLPGPLVYKSENKKILNGYHTP